MSSLFIDNSLLDIKQYYVIITYVRVRVFNVAKSFLINFNKTIDIVFSSAIIIYRNKRKEEKTHGYFGYR